MSTSSNTSPAGFTTNVENGRDACAKRSFGIRLPLDGTETYVSGSPPEQRQLASRKVTTTGRGTATSSYICTYISAISRLENTWYGGGDDCAIQPCGRIADPSADNDRVFAVVGKFHTSTIDQRPYASTVATPSNRTPNGRVLISESSIGN